MEKRSKVEITACPAGGVVGLEEDDGGG